MKTFILLIISIAAFIINAFTQESAKIEDVLEKHILAHGGEDAWANVQTIKFKGTYTGFSIEKPFTTIQKTPNLYRSDFGLGKFDVILAYNGKIGWTIDPWFDINYPRELNKSETNVVEQKAEICSPFLNYQDKGYKVEYLGEEELDGIKMHKIKLKRDNIRSETWYLNAETYLEYKQESMWDDFAYATPQETYFDDFRKIDGLIIPHYIERSFIIRNRIIEIQEVSVNEPVDEALFEMPFSDEMYKIAILEGHWSVTVQALGRRGWHQTDSTVVDIIKQQNIINTQLAYENYFKYNKNVGISYHSETDQYRMTEFDSFTSNMNLYTGTFQNDTLIFESATIPDTLKNSNNLKRYTISPIIKNAFTIEVLTSKNGQDWDANEKFRFERIAN